MDFDLSIIIACYNCADTLKRCLDSIPKNVGIEVILVDDHSTDNTSSVSYEYIEKYKDETIRYIYNEENVGAGKTRNKGIEMSTKKYITFLDSDDELSKSYLTNLSSILKKQYDCIIFDALQVKKDTESPVKMFYTNELREGVINQKDALVYVRGAAWGKIYKREVIVTNGVVFGSIKRNEDLIFTKIAMTHCEKIYYMEQQLYRYIENDQSLMHNKSLLTEINAIVAINSIKEPLLSLGFDDEFNSIYFLEILYATTLTLLSLGKSNKECRRHFLTMAKDYNSKDKYRKKYYVKYKLAYTLFSIGQYNVFKFVLRK